MIKPVNGHLLIDPVQQQGFMATERDTYEEVGVVLASGWINLPDGTPDELPKIGDKVYFDAWLAAKYPKGSSQADGYYWLVKWADVRAIEHVGA